MVQSYKKKPQLQKSYDTIVIGSGFQIKKWVMQEITSSPFIYLIESEAEYEDEINILELKYYFLK